ncbi:hotdog fold thioesterase [Parageobacillus thermoglucosidasius]|uniref:hotdog fold thioesterase n=1 Tax=Parageobacillus thermoglucosidasius TaxID=1426 RepID=UPI000E198B2A|nr:hotdog fold thioesterase [Parageobacillus thermoglucosidasius]RDE31488.1 hotdog fold thioesterase [Parageobacillus thermoglucosidasius]
MGDFMKKMKEDPFANYLGITIEDVEEGYAKVSMEIKGNLLNFHGSANGGAIFSLADVAFACASNSHHQAAVGIAMIIYYMQASGMGDRLVAIAREETKPHRLGVYRIEVLNDKGELVALAEGMAYRKRDKLVP